MVFQSSFIMDKWLKKIEKYLGIKADDVGIIAGGRVCMGNKITVALVQTLHKRAGEVAPNIGQLILDVGPGRVTGMKYLQIVEQFDCKYQLWLDSSEYRSDNLDELIKYLVGPVIGHIDKQDLINIGNFSLCEAFFFPTGFTPVSDPSVDYNRALTEMTQDLNRNRLIVETTMKYNDFGFTLILSESQQHCEDIANLLKHEYNQRYVAVITSQTPTEKRQQMIKDLSFGWKSFLVTTNQTIDKGFDLPKIETLVMATPVNFSSYFVENVLSALRSNYTVDKSVILNFVDDHGVFKSSARSSWERYKQLGLSVLGRIEKNI